MKKWFKLPTTATAPFCASEVRGSIEVPAAASSRQQLARFLGPGLLISVGYMDPGNWATDIAAGSQFGFSLLYVVVSASLMAIVLQYLSLKLGLVTGRDLAQNIQHYYGPKTNVVLWLFGELAIIACDVAEVLGTALAFKLLFGCNLLTGIVITALDTVIILSLQGKGFRRLEAIILGLVMTVSLCFVAQLFLARPDPVSIFTGLIPTGETLLNKDSWYLAIGIIGATVMPHNLYLHSSIVQTRRFSDRADHVKQAIKLSTIDSTVSLFLALFVNASILILAAQVFHVNGHNTVAEIEDAHALISPLLGTSLAGILFAVALLASGQSSTFTGTIAGQVIMEGHMKWKIPCWQRRMITRGLALLPAFFGVLWLGEHSVGKLLVLSQVVLSLQLPFALFPLIQFVGRKSVMGAEVVKRRTQFIGWAFFLVVTLANIWMLAQVFAA